MVNKIYTICGVLAVVMAIVSVTVFTIL